jgi:hypothetical protein
LGKKCLQFRKVPKEKFENQTLEFLAKIPFYRFFSSELEIFDFSNTIALFDALNTKSAEKKLEVNNLVFELIAFVKNV